MSDDEIANTPTVRDVVDRANSRGYGCNLRARRHEMSYRRWRYWSTLLSILSAIGSTIAGFVAALLDRSREPFGDRRWDSGTPSQPSSSL